MVVVGRGGEGGGRRDLGVARGTSLEAFGLIRLASASLAPFCRFPATRMVRA